MSITYCYKQQPQPWMYYITPEKIVFTGECCPALVTGNNCNVESVEIIYGYLYNWYAATDVREIAASGWHVPTYDEFQTLSTALGGNSVSGGKLKEVGLTHWSSPNTGATNEVGFNAKGSGARTNAGVFSIVMQASDLLTSTLYDATQFYRIELVYNNDNFYAFNTALKVGNSIRLIKDTTTLTDGQTGTYVGNDGKVYRTICIGTQEWLADNLCETKYRDLSPIPEVTDNATWAALTTGARCSFNNDESYALAETTICGQTLLPFQVISQGAFQKLEYRLYGDTAWNEIAITYSEVVIEGFYFISYNGEAITELPCGVYEFKLTAGEVWWFEPIKIEDFTISENTLTVRDELMTPFKISEQIIDTTPLIAPCDMIMPFMFRTSNVTSGTITVYMVDESGTETEITITVSTGVIDGMTYYWHSEEYLYPFLSCGRYYLKIVDGANTYYSVPFVPECGISDIPDGYKVLRDFNGCVIRDADGNIITEEASDFISPYDERMFGLIYNHYVVDDARGIAQDGWHIMTTPEMQSLCTYIGGAATAADKLREAGTWHEDIVGATNEYGFNMRASGGRNGGVFGGAFFIPESYYSNIWLINPGFTAYCYSAANEHQITFGNSLNINYPKYGFSIRLVRDATPLLHGESGRYTGTDGKIYRTICIGTTEVLADNLAETLFANGDPISEVTDDATWAALSTPALCALNNDWNNV